MSSLWGKLPEVQKITTPVKILSEQAAALQEMSGGVIVGEVRKLVSSSNSKLIINELMAVVPTLNNYRVRILRVSHEVLSYPCEVVALNDPPVVYNTNSEAEFIAVVGKILSDESLLTLLSNTIAQANAIK